MIDGLTVLAGLAWKVRDNAKTFKTAVGCAVVSSQGRIYTGCNLEHKFRCHDIHAEVNVLSSMRAAEGDAAQAMGLVIAAPRASFTPCGGCMDWIFELGTPDTVVAFSPGEDQEIQSYIAAELMPHYPH